MAEIAQQPPAAPPPEDPARPPAWFRYPERPWLVTALFLAFIVARYVQVGARREILATVRFEFILGALVLLVTGSQALLRRPLVKGSKATLTFIFLLFLTMIVQLPFAADPIEARTVFNDKVLKFAFMTFSMVVMIESPRTLRWFVGAFLFSLFYITGEAVRGLLDGGLIWENQGILRLHGGVPLYAHPNSLAGVSLGVVPFVLYLFRWVRSRVLRLGLAVLGIFAMVCIVYAGSRTSYLGLLALLVLLWLRSPRKLPTLAAGLVLGALTLAVLPQQYVDRFKSIQGEEAEGHSKDARIQILIDAAVIFRDNPFGVGVGSFPAVRMERFGRYQNTHNLYLEVGTNLGVQGLIVFLGLVAVMMLKFLSMGRHVSVLRKRLRDVARRGTPPPAARRLLAEQDRDLGFLKAVADATFAFIFIRLVVGFFGMDLYEVYWWFAAGLAIVLGTIIPSAERRLQAVAARLTEAPSAQEAPEIAR